MAITGKPLYSFPAGNPFHHDWISCGARLIDVVPIDERFYPHLQDCYIMFGGNLAEGLYIVNSRNGERMQIVIEEGDTNE